MLLTSLFIETDEFLDICMMWCFLMIYNLPTISLETVTLQIQTSSTVNSIKNCSVTSTILINIYQNLTPTLTMIPSIFVKKVKRSSIIAIYLIHRSRWTGFPVACHLLSCSLYSLTYLKETNTARFSVWQGKWTEMCRKTLAWKEWEKWCETMNLY
jgi:hypothetical protein